MEKPLTTGEIARICQVSQATVLNWIRDRGLHAYATPGGHYRVLPSELGCDLERMNRDFILVGSGSFRRLWTAVP